MEQDSNFRMGCFALPTNQREQRACMKNAINPSRALQTMLLLAGEKSFENTSLVLCFARDSSILVFSRASSICMALVMESCSSLCCSSSFPKVKSKLWVLLSLIWRASEASAMQHCTWSRSHRKFSLPASFHAGCMNVNKCVPFSESQDVANYR